MGASKTDGWARGKARGRPDEPATNGRPGRQRGRFWFDPRFGLGLVLVAGSVFGVGVLVSEADHTTSVYATGDTLSIGDRIEASDLVTERVRIPGAHKLYLTPGSLPPEGALVTRTVGAGELVPASAVGSATGASVTRVVVDVPGTLASAIEAGALVDVWAAKRGDRAEYGPPTVLVSDASVAAIVEAQSLIADNRNSAVEILVPKAKVAAILESIANDDSIALVPVHNGIER